MYIISIRTFVNIYKHKCSVLVGKDISLDDLLLSPKEKKYGIRSSVSPTKTFWQDPHNLLLSLPVKGKEAENVVVKYLQFYMQACIFTDCYHWDSRNTVLKQHTCTWRGGLDHTLQWTHQVSPTSTGSTKWWRAKEDVWLNCFMIYSNLHQSY